MTSTAPRRSPPLLFAVALAGLTLVGCSSTSSAERGPASSSEASSTQTAGSPAPAAEHGSGGAAHGPGGAPAESGEVFTGVVRETMNSGGYTYLQVEVDGGGPTGSMRWVAAEEAPIAVGDRVTIKVSMQMTNFTSKTLQRTFEQIWFGYIESSEGEAGEAQPASDMI